MLRRMFKNCLIVAMACSVGAPVFAADVSAKVNGRIRTWLEQVAVKDGTSTMQIKADGRLGGTLSATSGSWKVTAFQNMDLDSDAGKTNPTIRDQKITLGNESMDLTLGRFMPWGVTKGIAYGVGPLYDSYWNGENVLHDRQDHLSVSLKDVGLTVIVGLNNINDSATTGDAHNETTIGAVYGKVFGPVDLGVQYTTTSNKIDEKDSDSTTGGDEDGRAFNLMAVGVGYAISDKMGAAFNYESSSNTAGSAGAKAGKNTSMEFWFDLGLDDTSGVSIGYGTATYDNGDGSADKNVQTMTNLTYSNKIGIADLYASYKATTEKEDDAGTDTASNTVGAGLRVNF